MLRLCLELIGRLFIRNPKPSPVSSRPFQPTAFIPDPDGPVVIDWAYHAYLRDRLTGNPGHQEIVQLHFQRCFDLDPSTHTQQR